MAEPRAKLEVVERFFSGTGSSYDKIVVLGTCGLDRYWKRLLLARIPQRPARIVDQAWGTGIVTIEIARRYPDCRVTGVELREEYLRYARDKAQVLGLRNVDFALGRAEDVVVDGPCDCITSSYLAKYAELPLLAQNCVRMLRPGGVVIAHDFTYPSNRVFRSIWLMYFQVLRWVWKRAFPEWRTVFDELPSFLRQTRWVDELAAALRENGFCDVRAESLSFGTAAIVTARKPLDSSR